MPYYVKKDVKPDLSDKIIRGGNSAVFEFAGDPLDLNNHHRLYFTCEDRMHYVFKDEPYGDKLYMLIEDSLDQKNAEYDRFCLDMSDTEKRAFPRRAITKMVWGPSIGIYGIGGITDDWDFGAFVKADNLQIGSGGYLRLRLELFAVRPGHAKNETGCEPSQTVIIDIPEGSYGYTDFSKTVTIPKSTTACVLITVEGENYSGKVYFERPHLTASNGDNKCPAFDIVLPCTKESYRSHGWVGQSLSKKEWPRFEITLNGETFFEGEKFLRIHRYSPVEIEIPDGLVKENNTLEIKYLSDYHDTVPLAIRELKILEKKKAPFHIHYLPDCAVIGKSIPLLIETENDGMAFKIKSDSLEISGDTFFETKGLHVLTLDGNNYTNGMEFTLESDGFEVSAVINRAITRTDDSVVCGSGDLIYIDNSDMREVCDFIEWSADNSMPNLITIRPAYRWGGHRTINKPLWHKFVDICEKMGIDYVSISDGRDLPGQQCNPSPTLLEGERYLGLQQHERDGQLFYWGVTPNETHPIMEAYFDLLHRLYRESPDTTEQTFKGENMVMQRGVLSLRRDIDCRADMRDAANHAVNSIKITRGTLPTRHTGPSVMFKYFYQAGYAWTGAETMDSCTEPLLAFLRGAAKAYGKKRTGVHHAVQWSTRPHDTEQRYRRYLLANLVSYMQDVTDINTEEGLWFLECQYTFHNRFSDACVNHAKQMKKSVDFIKSHSRTGNYYTPTAFVHGRYDGWNGFGSANLFGMPHINVSDAEESWALLRIFYPCCQVGKSGMKGVTGFFPENSPKNTGLVSGTPNGNVDVVPIEASDFSDYRLVCFAGYNCAEPEDMQRLYDYVKNGGTLVGAWPHFSTVTYRPDIEAGNFDIIDCALIRELCGQLPVFENGTCVNFKDVTVIKEDQNGNPLVVKKKIGNGHVIMFNKLFYPGSPEIFEDYKELVTDLNAKELVKDSAQVICTEDVEYTAYKQQDGSVHFYVTPVDWHNEPTDLRHAMLRLGDTCHLLSLKFGEITKVVTNGNVAAYPVNSEHEVLSVNENTVIVQGSGKCEVVVFRNDKRRTYTVNIGKNPIAEIKL